MLPTASYRPKRLTRVGLAALALTIIAATNVMAASPELLLPPKNASDSRARGINNFSEVTGSIGDYDYEEQIGAVWDANGHVARELPSLPLAHHFHSRGNDINKNRAVVGISGEFYGVYNPTPVLWDPVAAGPAGTRSKRSSPGTERETSPHSALFEALALRRFSQSTTRKNSSAGPTVKTIRSCSRAQR